MISHIDPTVDYAFKRLFGSEERIALTTDLINAVLLRPKGRLANGLVLLNPFTPTQAAEAKQPIFDVRARDLANCTYTVEMQQAVPWSFGKRLAYYLAAEHAAQMQRGDDYQTIQTTCTISIANEPLIKEDDAWHYRFVLHDAGHGVTLNESFPDLELYLVELSKFRLKAEELRTPLERWCYFLRHGAGLDNEALPAQLDTPLIREALEVLNMLSQDERAREEYLEQLKARRLTATLVAERDGVIQQLQQAREQAERLREQAERAREQGLLIGQIQARQEVLRLPPSPSDELARMTIEELQRLAQELKARLAPQTNGDHA